MPLRLTKLPLHSKGSFVKLVRLTGLEPAFLAEMEPKSIVSASFTTGACNITIIAGFCEIVKRKSAHVIISAFMAY